MLKTDMKGEQMLLEGNSNKTLLEQLREVKKPSLVRLTDAALGTDRICGRDMPVIRGVLTPEYFGALIVPGYQRIAMLNAKHPELVAALDPDTGEGIPDDLMMCVPSGVYSPQGTGEFIIPVPDLNLLDGHQRATAAAARLLMDQRTTNFGVKVLIGPTSAEEVAIFYQLNRKQTKVSSHVHLRNSGSNAAIEALKELTEKDEGFPQVQWNQLKKSGDVITAHMLYEVAAILHGRAKRGTIEEILDGLKEAAELVGTDRLVRNVETFFELVRECFVDPYKKSGVLKPNDKAEFAYRIDFLRALAALLAGHEAFWDAQFVYKLSVRKDDAVKLRGLSKRDLERDLARGTAVTDLFATLRRQVDKLRSEKLVVRDKKVWKGGK